MKRLLSTSFGGALILTALTAPLASAYTSDDVEYQIKLKVNPSVLTSDGELTQQASQALGAVAKDSKETVVYFDTKNKDLAGMGWSVRLRLKQSSGAVDVTYKYRQKLPDNTLSKGGIGGALETAKVKELEQSATAFKPQVNASYNTSTLDLSYKNVLNCTGQDCFDDALAHPEEIFSSSAPKELPHVQIQDVHPSIVTEQNTWKVKVSGIKTDLEVSNISGEYWVEISEEETSRTDTLDKRKRLETGLESLGYLLPEDAFKTGFILDKSNNSVASFSSASRNDGVVSPSIFSSSGARRG